MACGPADVDYEDPFETLNITVDQCNCSDIRFMYHQLCDCDYPEAPPPTYTDVLPLGFIYTFFFIIGIIGNCMVIFVVARYRQMRSVTNVFLASLSTSDLCLILFCIPVQYAKYVSYSWIFGDFLCHSVHYVQLFTMICSVLTLTAISIERYVAIAYPMKAMGWSSVGRAKRIIAIIWVAALLLAWPSWFTNKIEEVVTKRNLTARWCVKNFDGQSEGTGSWMEKSYALYQAVVLFAIPVATMTYCYIQVARVLYFANRSTPDHTQQVQGTTDLSSRQMLLRKSSKMSDQSVKQIIQMLVAVVLLFIICWSPYVVDDLLIAFQLVCAQSTTEMLKYMRMAFAIMAYSNSCQNPLVYAFMSKHFKNKFLTFCCRCSAAAHRQDTMHSSFRCSRAGASQSDTRAHHTNSPTSNNSTIPLQRVTRETRVVSNL